MSIEEPTEIGTIMQRPDGKRFAVLLEPGKGYPWRACEAPDTYLAWVPWHDIKDWNLVHRGWTPPTPEPTGEGAVIRVPAGLIFLATDDPSTGKRAWMSTDGTWFKCWSDLGQPVEVLFAGVDHE